MDRRGDDPQTGYPQTGYMEDFFAWTQDQATKLRAAAASGSNLPVDWENLAEEIESVGRSNFLAVISHMKIVVEHLLKLEHSPAAFPRRGWINSVGNGRFEISLLVDDSPSLRRRLAEGLEKAWRGALNSARNGLEADDLPGDSLPENCPYTVEQVLDVAWLPVNRHGLT
jgi:hypothetical protein